MKRTFTLGAAAVLAALMLAGCNNQKDAGAGADAAAVNERCPYSHGTVNKNVTADHRGQKVAFCCDGCRQRWASATDADRDAMLSKVR